MNAYDAIYSAMRTAGAEAASAGAVRLRLGEVLSPLPLKIDVAGTVQEAERIKICRGLTVGSTCHASLTGTGQTSGGVSGPVSGSVACGGHGSPALTAITGGMLSAETVSVADLTLTRAEIGLKAGDIVLLLTDDDQTFYLVDKVVQAV